MTQAPAQFASHYHALRFCLAFARSV